jgi:hypothetical protein
MFSGGQKFRHIYGEEYQFGTDVDQAMIEGYIPYGNVTVVKDNNINPVYSICMIKSDLLEDMELMTKVMKLHPQLEEHILKGM